MNYEAATFKELREEARRVGVRPARSRVKTIERISRGPLTAPMVARAALRILHSKLLEGVSIREPGVYHR